jgi:hypothetical protein
MQSQPIYFILNSSKIGSSIPVYALLEPGPGLDQGEIRCDEPIPGGVRVSTCMVVK